MNERERFEAWYSYSHKPYLPDQIDTAWHAWQAGREDAIEEGMKLAEEICRKSHQYTTELKIKEAREAMHK